MTDIVKLVVVFCLGVFNLSLGVNLYWKHHANLWIWWTLFVGLYCLFIARPKNADTHTGDSSEDLLKAMAPPVVYWLSALVGILGALLIWNGLDNIINVGLGMFFCMLALGLLLMPLLWTRISSKNCYYCIAHDRDSRSAQGIPDGYCGMCSICGQAGHTQPHPGSVSYTGTWCDRCLRVLSIKYEIKTLLLQLILWTILGWGVLLAFYKIFR